MAEASKSPLTGWHQMTAFLSGTTGQQRRLLLAAGVAVAATLAGFVWMMATPKMVVLYSGLKPTDTQSLGSRLAAKNIRYELSPDGGTLNVEADKLDAARLETAAQGLPHNARLGFEIFDTPNWAGSDFTEKVNYQRALEGELERTLQTMSEVEAVRVHLVLPEDSLFQDKAREAKAAIVLKTRNGRLSDEAQQAIPQLVASAVDGLKADNVTVIDADSQKPLLRRNSSGKTTFTEDEGLAQAVVRTLEPVVGNDHVRASVHLEYDLSSMESTEDSYDPKSAVPVSVQRTEEGAGGAVPGGIPGTASNVPGASAAAAATSASNASEQQNARSEASSYVVNRVTRKTSQPAGRLRRVTASVLVDDAAEVKDQNGKKTVERRKRTPEEMKQIEQLAGGVLGLDTARGDLLTVANMSFQLPPEDHPAPPAKVDEILKMVRPWLPLLRQLGIALLFVLMYLMMLRPIKAQLLAAFRKAGRSPATVSETMLTGKPGSRSLDSYSASSDDPAVQLDEVKKLVVDKIKLEPAEAGKMLAAWMQEPSAAVKR